MKLNSTKHIFNDEKKILQLVATCGDCSLKMFERDTTPFDSLSNVSYVFLLKASLLANKETNKYHVLF